MRYYVASATSRKGPAAAKRRGAFRPLAMLLCGAIAYLVIANVACAKTILSFVEMAEPCLTTDTECVPVFNISGENGPFIIRDNVLNISIANGHVESNNSPMAGRYVHISSNNDFGISCDVFGGRFTKHLQVCDYINTVSGRLADIQRNYTRVSKIPRFPYVNTVSLDIDVSPQLPFGGLLRKSGLVASGYGSIASRESGDSCKYQGADDKPQANSAKPQLPKRIIGGALSGGRHALLFAQISLVVILSIAAWGPIYLGLRFLAFGNPRIPSDFILTPRFLIGWSFPRLVGFFTLCCGLFLIGGSGWLAWLLRE
jgi:hypothetical protein